MSVTVLTDHRPALAFDDRRGSWGMLLFIVTEAMLFVMLFFGYYYLGADEPQWPTAEPPRLHYALPMLALLLLSSAVLYWGEERVTKDRAHGSGRLAVLVTLALATGFVALSYFDYAERLRSLPWRTNAYSSIYYTIISFHLAHLVLGMCMLAYTLVLPLGPGDRPPHRPLHNAGMYWHFVDLVWVAIVALLYVAPYFS